MKEIIKYNEAYEKKVKTLIFTIFVNEYGYKNCEEEIFNEDLNSYFNQDGCLWIALDDEDNVIGTIAAKILDDETIELKRMYVDLRCRSKGVSRELMKVFEDFSKSKKCKYIRLSTRNNLRRAISFYKKYSFIVDNDETIARPGVVHMYKEI